MLVTKKLNVPPVLIYGGAGLLFLLALVLRVSLYQIRTGDYTVTDRRLYRLCEPVV